MDLNLRHKSIENLTFELELVYMTQHYFLFTISLKLFQFDVH